LRAATEQMAISQREVNELSRLRKSLIQRLRAEGLSFAQIGEAAGLTRGRIHQILQAGPPTEGRFFGRSPITVAVPLRKVPGRSRPVLSSEDARAYEDLVGLLNDLGHQAQRLNIPPDGQWTPPAGSVVAICGPKPSPVTADAIATDPYLAFEPDETGQWTIRERETGTVYQSPLDSAEGGSADVAYLGRLTVNGRPMLVIAGIHALGSVGAVHYLGQHLHQLYERVGTDNFSM